ncbi:MAG TPA: hypothetical protein VGM25_13265 [Caulobacteraceae bacterium]|jgi:ElaB/YqjD/DUF883 family membrane-anchored ribosome-binding protein
MNFLSSDFDRPARKASRAGKAAARTAQATAMAVADEARTFSKKSARHVNKGMAKGQRQAQAVRSAGEEAAEIAGQSLRAALENLQGSSAELSRWAGSKASEYRDQAGAVVRERPVSSLGSMLAIGALLGLLMSLTMRRGGDYGSRLL